MYTSIQVMGQNGHPCLCNCFGVSYCRVCQLKTSGQLYWTTYNILGMWYYNWAKSYWVFFVHRGTHLISLFMDKVLWYSIKIVWQQLYHFGQVNRTWLKLYNWVWSTFSVQHQELCEVRHWNWLNTVPSFVCRAWLCYWRGFSNTTCSFEQI